MQAAEEHLLIFERHFSAEKRCRPPSGWWTMPSACFSAPLPRGLVEGASAGRYPQRSRPSKQRHNDERLEPRRSLRSSPKDEPVGRRRGKKSTNVFSPAGCGDPNQRPQSLWLRGVARGPAALAWHFACPAVASHPLRQPTAGMLVPQAALPAAHSLAGRCFASATASRNGLYAIKSALP
jgi:hypothetical protein